MWMTASRAIAATRWMCAILLEMNHRTRKICENINDCQSISPTNLVVRVRTHSEVTGVLGTQASRRSFEAAEDFER